MIANYHTHTPRCRHAQGQEREYMENAGERGLKLCGFSDHTPQWFPGGYYSTMRMFPHQLEGYCQTVRELQKEYAGRLEIPLGVEVENYPDIFSELLLRLRDAGIEYMLLGQHWIGNEEGEPYSGRATEDVRQLERYCNQVIDGMYTGLFTYVAHPDLLYFVGSPQVYQAQMRRLCKAAVATDTPLEINLLGILTNRHYPRETFWQIAAEEGCKTVLGIDAHSPQELLELSPAECIVVEDSPAGIRAANAAGMKAVLVPDRAAITQEIIDMSDVVLESLLDMPAYVKGLMNT